MADNPEDRLEEKAAESNNAEMDEPIKLDDIASEPTDIELDDIAIGATDEDEEIIELTEEVIGSARQADSEATGSGGEAETPHLTGFEQADEETEEELFVDPDADLDEEWLTEEAGTASSYDSEAAAAEADIDKELEDYFDLQETDEFISLGREAGIEESEPTITPEMLDAALERVLSKMYGEKIERLIAEMVEKKLAEKADRL